MGHFCRKILFVKEEKTSLENRPLPGFLQTITTTTSVQTAYWVAIAAQNSIKYYGNSHHQEEEQEVRREGNAAGPKEEGKGKDLSQGEGRKAELESGI